MKPFEDDGNTSQVVVSMNALQQQPVIVGHLALDPADQCIDLWRKAIQNSGLSMFKWDFSR